MKKLLASSLALCVVLAACGGSDSDETMDEAPIITTPSHTVTILEPEDGSTVEGPRVTVRLATTVPLAQAGEMTPGTGHHHIFLDGDVSPEGQPIPNVPGTVVHLGDASSEFTFDAVAPGRHRIIAVMADFAHVPLVPPVVDTVFFTVE